jgi:flagellar biosynthetic protein FlhB
LAEDQHSKTEQPTAKKLTEAKKKGPPQSRDLTSTVTLLAAIVGLSSTGRYMFAGLAGTSREILANVGTYQVTTAGVYSLMLKLFGVIGMILAPFLLTVMVAGIVANLVQGGISISSEKLGFKFDKLNPMNGFKRIFNKRGLVELLKSSLKIGIVGYMSYRIIRAEADSLSFLSDKDVKEIFDYVSRLSFRLVVNSCGVLFILGLLDLAFVKWKFVQDLKMTKEEIKDETKQSEGDPKIKGKIRKMQFERGRQRMLTLIPTADVVITNPTHFAVALKYDRENMGAPVVIAKGADFLALKIKEIAKEHKIMLVENRFLARELYASVQEGQEIPETLYAAVAEVLAYVFRLKGMM